MALSTNKHNCEAPLRKNCLVTRSSKQVLGTFDLSKQIQIVFPLAKAIVFCQIHLASASFLDE
jgi:hypothetical protein